MINHSIQLQQHHRSACGRHKLANLREVENSSLRAEKMNHIEDVLRVGDALHGGHLFEIVQGADTAAAFNPSCQ